MIFILLLLLPIDAVCIKSNTSHSIFTSPAPLCCVFFYLTLLHGVIEGPVCHFCAGRVLFLVPFFFQCLSSAGAISAIIARYGRGGRIMMDFAHY